MDLEFEPETSHLWAVCDDTCNGRSATLDIAPSGANAGRFVVTNTFERPAGMANLNNEGFAITPQRECVGGHKPVFWSDDNNTDSHALRAGTLNCTVIVDPQTITFDQPAPIPFGSGPVALVASSTSGLTVGFSATGPCSVAGAAAAPTLTASGAGSCVVTATQPGSATFKPATPVARTVAITQAPTALTQTPVSLLGSLFSLRVTYRAVLRSQVTGGVLVGQTVAFRASNNTAGAPNCSAVTDATGTATCASSAVTFQDVRRAGATTASYAGTDDYQASSTTTPVTY